MALSFDGAIKKATALDKVNSAIIFGEYGTGKTIFGASASEIEDYGPVLILDVEGSVAGVGRIHPDVDVLPVPSHQHLEHVMHELLNEEHKYKTVIVDTFNVAQNRAEKFFKAKPENQNNKFGTYADLKDWSIDFIRKMHHAPFLGILIAHPQVDKDENTGRLITTVKMTGSAKQDVPAIPDLIGYMGTAENENGDPVAALYVGRSTSYITKNRFGLPDVIMPDEGEKFPTFSVLQREILAAGMKEEEDGEG